MKRKIIMFWHGGSSYARFDLDDKEVFSSLKDAKRAFADRVHDSYYPCVSNDPPEMGGPEAWIFYGEVSDYPHAIMHFGKRGGVVVKPA